MSSYIKLNDAQEVFTREPLSQRLSNALFYCTPKESPTRRVMSGAYRGNRSVIPDPFIMAYFHIVLNIT